MQVEAMSASYLDRMILIRGFAGMSGISAGALSLIAERSEGKFFRAGERLSREGDPPGRLYFLLQGTVELRWNGRATTTLGAGEVCDAMAVFAGEPRGAEAVATTDVKTLAVLPDDTARIFRDNFDLTVLALRKTSLYLLDERLRRPAVEETQSASTAPIRSRLTFADRLEALLACFPFAGDRLDAFAEVARGAEEVRLPAGAVLWTKGDAARDFLLPLAGEVEGSIDKSVFRLPRGRMAGFLETLGEYPRWHTAKTKSPLVALRFQEKRLLDVLEDQPELALTLVGELAREVIAHRRSGR